MDLTQWGEIWALASALFWAVAVIFFKKVGESISPLALNLFKNSWALAVFIPLVLLLEDSLVPDHSADDWMRLVASGVIGITVADTLFFAALNRLGAGLNAVVDCLYAPLMITQAALFLHERLPVLALVGTALIVFGILLGSLSRGAAGVPRRETVIGILLAGLGMLAITSSIVLIKPILVREEILWVSMFRLVCGTLPLLPLALLAREGPSIRNIFRPSSLWRSAVPASLFGGVLAMAAWIAGFALREVSYAAILNQLSTIFIFVLAAIFLREPLTPRRVTAVTLAFAGAVLAWWTA